MCLIQFERIQYVVKSHWGFNFLALKEEEVEKKKGQIFIVDEDTVTCRDGENKLRCPPIPYLWKKFSKYFF